MKKEEIKSVICEALDMLSEFPDEDEVCVYITALDIGIGDTCYALGRVYASGEAWRGMSDEEIDSMADSLMSDYDQATYEETI